MFRLLASVPIACLCVALLSPHDVQSAEKINAFGHVQPEAMPATSSSKPRLIAFGAQPEDRRPVMIVYTQRGEGRCLPCERLQRDEEVLPFRLEWRDAPEWVRGRPTILWRTADGREHYSEGYSGIEPLLSSYQSTVNATRVNARFQR